MFNVSIVNSNPNIVYVYVDQDKGFQPEKKN